MYTPKREASSKIRIETSSRLPSMSEVGGAKREASSKIRIETAYLPFLEREKGRLKEKHPVK